MGCSVPLPTPPGSLLHGLVAGHRGFQVQAVAGAVVVVVVDPLGNGLIEGGGGQRALVPGVELGPGGAIDPLHPPLDLGRTGVAGRNVQRLVQHYRAQGSSPSGRHSQPARRADLVRHRLDAWWLLAALSRHQLLP